MSKRYGMQCGSYPKIEAAIHISGPQSEEQVDPAIRDILSKPGIKQLAIIYDHGLGERIDIYNEIKATDV